MRFALALLAALAACADPPQPVAQPTPERVLADVEHYAAARYSTPATVPWVEEMLTRLETYPDLYVPVIDRRLVFPTTAEGVLESDSLRAYFNLLEALQTSSESAWAEKMRDVFDSSVAASDALLTVATDSTRPEAQGQAYQAVFRVEEVVWESLWALKSAEDPHAVPVVRARWEDLVFARSSLDYLETFGIDPRTDPVVPPCEGRPATAPCPSK